MRVAVTPEARAATAVTLQAAGTLRAVTAVTRARAYTAASAAKRLPAAVTAVTGRAGAAGAFGFAAFARRRTGMAWEGQRIGRLVRYLTPRVVSPP
ncbi:hypothetical protein T492DRAFT_859922 [Pavlovales sp. CCMP2436]|nr:hypothetical protein T492DRAFT_859922 [Pavlovales sp. CCMP2436]